MTESDPIDGEKNTTDTVLDMPVKETAAKLETELFNVDSFYDEQAEGSGVRILSDTAMNPILLVGTITPTGEEQTTAAYLPPEQCRELGKTLLQEADKVERRRKTNRENHREEQAESTLRKALEAFK